MNKEPMLAPYRILDLTNEWGFLCGRILADLGSDVIKVEKPGGDPARKIGPFYHDIPDPEKSLYWFFYNANKKGITLNIETQKGQEIFKQLLRKTDFVIESFKPGYLDSLGLGYSELSKINPRIIVTSITPFGQSGPYSELNYSDIVVNALSGWMYKCGDPDRAPLQIGIPQAYLHGAAQAVSATLMAHYHRELTGEGQHVDAEPFTWMAYFSQAAARYYVTKGNERRLGSYWDWSGKANPRYIWPCKDGYVCFAIAGGGPYAISNEQIIKWMDSEGMSSDLFNKINWRELDFRLIDDDFRKNLEDTISAFFKQKTKAEISKESIKRRIVLFPANNAKEILEDNQLSFRDYWVKVEHPELGMNITYPGAFFKSTETSWILNRRAPLVGEHNKDVYIGELGFSEEDVILLKQNQIV